MFWDFTRSSRDGPRQKNEKIENVRRSGVYSSTLNTFSLNDKSALRNVSISYKVILLGKNDMKLSMQVISITYKDPM